jgi:hypothetical protein
MVGTSPRASARSNRSIDHSHIPSFTQASPREDAAAAATSGASTARQGEYVVMYILPPPPQDDGSSGMGHVGGRLAVLGGGKWVRSINPNHEINPSIGSKTLTSIVSFFEAQWNTHTHTHTHKHRYCCFTLKSNGHVRLCKWLHKMASNPLRVTHTHTHTHTHIQHARAHTHS